MIIKSLLDTDLYKLTMMQVVYHRYPTAMVKYSFKCRSGEKLGFMMDQISKELKNLETLKLRKEEADYLRGLGFFKEDFVDLLESFRFNSKYIKMKNSNEDLVLEIEGSWLQTILFEVPLLAIINELYFKNKYPQQSLESGRKRLFNKIKKIKDLNDEGFSMVDFGSRRRYSSTWQEEVVTELSNSGVIKGTSNVMLAQKLGLNPVGTMAHEYLQAGQALGPKLRDSQKFALMEWLDEYRGQLGIALSDVCGMRAFLSDFDLLFSKAYDGVRHDSGDPYDWTKSLLNHYKKMGIDPKTKKAVFSDGLNVDKAINIWKEFKSEINCSFGIGTNLTNDFEEFKPMQIVIKMVECNGQPVAKISDSTGKQMCKDETYLAHLKRTFGIDG